MPENCYLPSMGVNENVMAAMGVMYRAGKITTFADFFDYVPPSLVAKAIGFGHDRFKKKMANPSLFTKLEQEKLAALFHMTVEELKEVISRSE